MAPASRTREGRGWSVGVAQLGRALVGFSPAIVVAVTLALRDVSADSLFLRLLAAGFFGAIAQGGAFLAIWVAIHSIKRLLGLPVSSSEPPNPLAPEMVAATLVALSLWAWASTDDWHLPRNLAECFSTDLDPSRIPTEADVRWCMQMTREGRVESDPASEW